MGDRVVVRFKNTGPTPMPEVYLHWSGFNVGNLLTGAASRMRAGDPTYQVARFIGHCHEKIEGGLSLGVAPDGFHGDQGDAGTVFVDLKTGDVSHDGNGYRPDNLEKLEFGSF